MNSPAIPLPVILDVIRTAEGGLCYLWTAAGPRETINERIEGMSKSQKAQAVRDYYSSRGISPPNLEKPAVLNHNHRLVRRAKKLLADLADANLVFSLATGGGQPAAFIHAAARSIEVDHDHAECVGSKGVGEMIAW